ncbi:hypothetical protein BDV38DRAFT_141164 [Aspergillus pseudotamarii]|uniref:Uncharacterized protein n=1 Tax=Aspergillus pseudotamarii TaxID=132259 RepID=A0A5N6SL04_ASPPS|nr:uncharacterized protein BDV38DRAFT_141164 [Aspergillus pseudotamarii]KAE8135376.1 hypothetical protein BDV38DRAFT_141164 [Aspergillus pseudotamarii]
MQSLQAPAAYVNASLDTLLFADNTQFAFSVGKSLFSRAKDCDIGEESCGRGCCSNLATCCGDSCCPMSSKCVDSSDGTCCRSGNARCGRSACYDTDSEICCGESGYHCPKDTQCCGTKCCFSDAHCEDGECVSGNSGNTLRVKGGMTKVWAVAISLMILFAD